MGLSEGFHTLAEPESYYARDAAKRVDFPGERPQDRTLILMLSLVAIITMTFLLGKWIPPLFPHLSNPNERSAVAELTRHKTPRLCYQG